MLPHGRRPRHQQRERGVSLRGPSLRPDLRHPADKQLSKNYRLPGGTYKAYDNREPRFYASIGFSGALWQMESTTSEEMRNQIVEYYNGANAGKNQAGVTNIYNLTGYTCYKYVHPRDARTGRTPAR